MNTQTMAALINWGILIPVMVCLVDYHHCMKAGVIPLSLQQVAARLSSFGLMSFMELGDSFGAPRFSPEDTIFNALGAYGGYLLQSNKPLAKKVDFRIEYLPKLDGGGLFTDYDRMKFLLAVKLAGFNLVTNPWLKYLEWHTGYYTRGYSQPNHNRERNLYIGIGVNLSRLMSPMDKPRLATLFNYYQLPGASITVNRGLNN